MDIKINDSTMKELEELAKMKNMTVQEVASIVLENYTSKYLLHTKKVELSVERALKGNE